MRRTFEKILNGNKNEKIFESLKREKLGKAPKLEEMSLTNVPVGIALNTIGMSYTDDEVQHLM